MLNRNRRLAGAHLWWPDLRRRERIEEVMDEPDLPAAEHRLALRGLERLNRLSCSASAVWPHLARLASDQSKQPVRVLDIATGSGDIPVALALRAQSIGVPLQLAGCDVSQRAVEIARQRAQAASVDVDFFTLDAVGGELPDGFDAVICSLFLHHLESEQAVDLLRRMYQKADRLVVVNDLVRSRPSWLQVLVASRVLSRSTVVHTDGPRSVQAAFTVQELHEMAREAGWQEAQVRGYWPCRMVLLGRKADG